MQQRKWSNPLFDYGFAGDGVSGSGPASGIYGPWHVQQQYN
jgi:hypothetical protein